ncbi:MAG: serine/threonine-protein kinase [Actinoplanes sp.]
MTGSVPGEAATADLSGRCVGNSYVLVCPVGHGATGTVWRGIDRSSGADVAVKLLHEGLLRQPKMVIRFVQERTILMMMRHENIVGVRDLFSVGDSLALVMDYVAGGSLRERLRSVGTMPPAEAAGLLGQVAAALAQAHELGVVHRDVKPDNILLQEVAGRFEVRLTDFGIARVLDTAGLTTPQAIIGTPHYMAPEAIRGEAEPASDVYAVGVALYELVTGRPPYAGEPLGVLRGHLDETPQQPPGMPHPVWELIRWCLAKDPADRPDTAELGDALRDLARRTAGVPAMAAPAETTEALGVSLSALPSIRPAPARRRRPRNGPRSWKWRRPGMMVALITAAAAVSGLGGFNAWQMLGTPGGTTDRPAAIGAGPAAIEPSVVGPSAVEPSAIGQPAATAPVSGTAAGLAAPLPEMAGAPAPRPPDAAKAGGGRAQVSAGPVRAGVSAGPGGGRAEVAFGPWRCGDEYSWDVGHPVLARPCHALGPAVRSVAQIEAMPGVQADVSLTVRDASSDEIVAGPYTCKALMFTDFALKHSCGPVDLRPPRGGRYLVAESWEYTKRSLIPGGVTRGPAFDW